MSLMAPPTCSLGCCHLGSHKISWDLHAAILDCVIFCYLRSGWRHLAELQRRGCGGRTPVRTTAIDDWLTSAINAIRHHARQGLHLAGWSYCHSLYLGKSIWTWNQAWTHGMGIPMQHQENSVGRFGRVDCLWLLQAYSWSKLMSMAGIQNFNQGVAEIVPNTPDMSFT